MKTTTAKACAALAIALPLALAGVQQAQAADWSDTYIGYRYGTQFSEPYNPNDIKKNIYSLTHVSGYKYGTNFLNVDLLDSDAVDGDAQEAYIVYRHTLDLGKVTGSKAFAFGPVRGMGVTAGFDWNTKNDTGYASKKRMLVVGPTFMMDVPGFLNISLLLLHESNHPNFIANRYTYDTHAMLNLAWGIPIGGSNFAFEGFMNYIAAKGLDETGAKTKPETNIDAAIMYDVGAGMGGAKNTFRIGVGYQYWKNKFGNDASGPAGPGAFAKTPMIKAEYHF